MSPRQQAAEQIAEFIRNAKLTRPFGGDVSKSSDGRYYGVLFAYPRLLDGLVRVYGPTFVLVEAQGPLARYGSRAVFGSVADAIKFIKAAFIDHDQAAADAVPVKPSRR